jgi:predicted RNA-binding protein associated with RNAse of E/G family
MFQPGSERIVETHHPDGAIDVIAAAEQIYVHMASPPSLTAEGVSFIDLVLDVVRLPDGTVTVLDEDELDSLVAECSIPLDAVSRARLACDEVAEMLREDIEPFGEVWADWLDRFLDGRRR